MNVDIDGWRGLILRPIQVLEGIVYGVVAD